MTVEMRRTIIIALGEQGHRIVQSFEVRLQRQYGELPFVQTITLLSDDEADGPGRLSLSLPSNEVEALKQKSYVKPWLPNIDDLDLTCRAGGRLAFLKQYHVVETKLHETIDEILNVQSGDLLLKKGIYDAVTIDFYVIANLADPLSSGAFIDLAYLIHKVNQERAGDNYHSQTAGLLLLPQLHPDWEGTTPARKRKMRSDTYAALKELDYYMARQSFPLNYPDMRRMGEFIKHPPFAHKYCYFLELTNETMETARPTDVIEMAAEWFYYTLFAPVYSRLEADFSLTRYGADEAAIGAYSSFGLATLILPLRYARDYCARRLVFELIRDFLLREDEINRDFRSLRVFDIEQLEKKLVGERDKNDRLYDSAIHRLGGHSPFSYLVIEKDLNSVHEKCRGTYLPSIVAKLDKNRLNLREDIQRRLHEKLLQIFDHDPDGAISRSLNFLNFQLDVIRKMQSELKETIQDNENKIEISSARIKEKRGYYFNQAQIFGSLPFFIPLLATVIFLLTTSAFVYIILGVEQSRPAEAVAMIVFGLIAFVLTAWSHYGTVTPAHDGFSNQYASRLETQRNMEVKRKLLVLLAEIASDTQRELIKVIEFQDEMKELQNLAEKEWQEIQPWDKKLYGNPDFSMEMSVLRPEDVETYYDEVFGKSKQDKNRHIKNVFPRYGGRYTDWFSLPIEISEDDGQTKSKIENLWHKLYTYSQTVVNVLDQHYLVEKVEERSQEDTAYVRKVIEITRRHAQPFLRARMRRDMGEIGEDIVRKESVVVYLAGNEDDRTQNSKVVQTLRQLNLLEHVDNLEHKERLTFISVRHGLPLYILPNVKNCALSYHQHPQGDLHRFHIIQNHSDLPDIIEQATQLETETLSLDLEQVFALSAAFICLNLQPPFLRLRYQNKTGGESDNKLTSRLGYYLIYINREEAKIARSLGREPRQISRYLGSGKAEMYAALHINQQMFSYLRQEVSDYLDEVALDSLTDKLYDYIYQPEETTDWLEWEQEVLKVVLKVFSKQIENHS